MQAVKYCPSCLAEKPAEGGKYYYFKESKRRQVAMWRCAKCVEKKEEFLRRQKALKSIK